MRAVRVPHNTTERIRLRTHPDNNINHSRNQQIRQAFLLLLLTITVFFAAAFTHNFIPSQSMEPNLRPGDHILTMREWLAYPFGAMPSRGDIIVFRMPNSPHANDSALPPNSVVDAATRRNTMKSSGAEDEADEADQQDQTPAVNSKPEILIKRVVGLPGDLVQLKDNALYVNGQLVQENYRIVPIDASEGYEFPYAVYKPLRVPPGQLFVLGDNRSNSDDGRFWGTLPRQNVMGKMVRVLYHESKYDVTESVYPTRRK